MLSKENFIKAIEAIQKDDAARCTLEKTLEQFSDSWVIFKPSQSEKILLYILEDTMNDPDNIISWWLYEDVEKVIYNADNTVYKDVSSVDQLYDYLVEISHNPHA